MSTPDATDVAQVGSALGHPVRVDVLDALMGGRWLTSGELARRAGVAPSSATDHLTHLRRAGLVRRRRSGRHRYYALAGREVAATLEAVLRVSARLAESDGGSNANERGSDANECGSGSNDVGLRFARTCYDHLAGSLGVRLAHALVGRELVTAGMTDVTREGEAWLAELGIEVASLRRRRRAFARPCLDWSERGDHLAGAVGAALAVALERRRWIARVPDTRAVRLTVRGADGLRQALGVELT